LLVKRQEPRAAVLEIWDDYGSPVERVGVDDERWGWEGEWKRQIQQTRAGEVAGLQCDQSGCEGRISFTGTGAILVGGYFANGGLAEIYLDGNLHKNVDVNSDEDHDKGYEAVWHAFQLQPGEHDLRVVVKGEPYRDSSGSLVEVLDLIVFQ